MRTGLVGAVAAVTALSAIAVFGASLSHLMASPELYGDPWQAFFNAAVPHSPDSASVVSELERDPAIDRITVLTGGDQHWQGQCARCGGGVGARRGAAVPVRRPVACR